MQVEQRQTFPPDVCCTICQSTMWTLVMGFEDIDCFQSLTCRTATVTACLDVASVPVTITPCHSPPCGKGPKTRNLERL